MAAANVILLEVQPRNTTTGARTTIRLAGAGGDCPYRYGGNDWQPGIKEVPSIVAALDYTGDDLGTGAVPQALALDWAPGSKAALDALLGYHWQGAPFTIYLGAENTAGTMPATLMTGTVLRAQIADSVLQLAMADPAADLQRPIIVDTFAGTGGVEGPAEWEGRVKRRAWGYCFNVEGFGIDTANNVYSFSDPSRPLNNISEVRDKGAVLTIQATIAWAGSIAATYAALQAATVAPGSCKIAPSIGMAKTWTRPAGILAADLLGEASGVTGSFESSPGRIAAAIIAARGGPGQTADAGGLRPVPSGFLADDLQTTLAQALDYILGGSSLFWVLDTAGTIRVGEWTFGASQGAFTSDHVDRIAYYPPLQKRKLGYRRNHRQMAAGDLAAILTYGDGTPIDNLQPSEIGATVGARLGTNLKDSGGTVQGDAAVKNSAVSISAGGALAGAGGGQVTIAGIAPNLDPFATRGENLVINGDFSQGQTGYQLGSGAGYQTFGAGDPAPSGVVFSGTGAPFAYMNNSGFIAVKPGKLYVGADFVGGSGTTLQAVVQPYDTAGNALGGASFLPMATVGGTWAKVQNSVTLPVNTAKVQIYFQKSAGANPIYGTNFFASPVEVGATLGAAWATNLTSRPANLAALTGSEGVNNAAVSISSAGALAGAGGGQVTISGLAPNLDPNATRGENLIINGDLVQGPTGFYLGSNVTYSGLLPAGWPAPYALVFVTAVNGFFYPNNANAIPAKTGPLFVGADFIASVGGDVITVGVTAYDSAGNSLGSQAVVFSAISGTMTKRQGSIVLPATTAKVIIYYQQTTRVADVYAMNFFASPVEVGATVGATWSTNLSGRPSNVAALSGSEGINNAAVSISSGGALSGAGGGQVTIGGLGFAGDLTATSGANLIVNPGGEDAATAPYITHNASGGSTFGSSTAQANTGARSLALEKTSTGGSIAFASGAVPVTPGKTYSVRVMLKGSGATGSGIYIALFAKATKVANVTPSNFENSNWNLASNFGAPAAWSPYDYKWTCPAGMFWASVNVYNDVNGPLGLYVDDVYLSDVEPGADVTLLVTGSKTVSVAFDYTGAVKTGQLPLDVNFKVANLAGTDLTTAASWAGVLKSGTATFTPTVGSPNATGTLNVTAMSTDAVIEMQATYGGKTVKGSATLIKNQDSPPVGGGGSGGSGTSASTSSITSTTSSSYGAANTSVLSVQAGSGGVVNLAAGLAFYRSSNGTGTAAGKWQWRVVGGSFADVTTEIASDSSAFKSGAPEPANDPGSVSVTMQKTGLTNGTTYEFQLLLRSGGSYTLTYSGTASATGA